MNARFEKNVSDIETALAGIAPNDRDCVYVWPDHWLAVKVQNRNLSDVTVMGVAYATRFPAHMKRVYTNGSGQRAILMNREKALRSALAHAVKVRDHFAIIAREAA